jgi:hypothetical protein
MQMIVLFAGEGLELLAHKLQRHIPACVHRVAEAVGQPRSVFIFEQKYTSLMRAGKEALRYACARWMVCRDVCCPLVCKNVLDNVEVSSRIMIIHCRAVPSIYLL